MDTKLWSKVLDFDLDEPLSEYCFSVRLAKENFWTKNFTEKAITEYKKFMYLAATSEFMVSPSEVVDIVWHQHLIFTKSYSSFCKLLGKEIQHIPSTHNREEFVKFNQAKERTKKLYSAAFGEQPQEIWGYSGMYKALNLPKATLKIKSFIIAGISIFIALIVPFYLLLKPLYIHINSSVFLTAYLSSVLLVLIILDFYNRAFLKKLMETFSRNSFIFHLTPLELVYLKTQNLSSVINGNLSQLVDKGNIKVSGPNSLKKSTNAKSRTVEEYTIIETLQKTGTIEYPKLSNQLCQKPVFTNIAGSMDAFKKYFIKSKAFGKLFCLNFILLNLLLMLGFVRLSLGFMRDKPIIFIAAIVIILVILIIVYLMVYLPNFICKHTIPDVYRNEILPVAENKNHWEWQYFLYDTEVIPDVFIPVMTYVHRSSATTSASDFTSSDSSSDSSCGSSCGSSCSSCGGCGGD